MVSNVQPIERLDESSHVVVVGAGLSGWRLVEALRRDGYRGVVTVIGDEEHRPYDRPPLSKQVLTGVVDLHDTGLVRSGSPDDVTWRLGVAAVGLDIDRREVRLADGGSVAATHVVIATGTRARRLTTSAGKRVHVLRTIDDVQGLNDDLARVTPGSTIAIIGGGFIGAEVASSLTKRGFRAVVLEMAPRPLLGVLGEHVSTWLLDLPAVAGVELRTDQRVSDVEEGPDALLVRIDGSPDVVAQVVVTGVGAIPNVEWLNGSGLALENGVVVDSAMQAAPGVAAIGDVARFEWSGPVGSALVRMEHWQVANDHATTLARAWLTGERDEAPFIPYFWSDQYGKKIQLLGHPEPNDDVTRVLGDDASGRWLALYHRNDVVTGIVALSSPRALMLAKVLLGTPTTVREAIARAPWSS